MSQESVALRKPRDLSQIIEASFGLYTQHFDVLFTIAAVSIPLAIASAVVQDIADDPATILGLLMLFGVAQALVNLLVAAALIAALRAIDAGRPATFGSAFDAGLARFGTIILAGLRALFHIVLFAITIVGIPWAIQRAVRWLFIEQAIMVDDTSAKAALSYSADAVIGRWWRTLGIVIVIWIITVVPSSVISGLFFLAPALISGTLGALVSAALLPFGVTALTLLYLDLRARKEADADARVA